MHRKRRLTRQISILPADAMFHSKALAAAIGINRRTLDGYLESHPSLFPPIKQDQNGHHLYNGDTIRRLSVFQRLRGRPFRVAESEIIVFLGNHDIDTIWTAYIQSNDDLLRLLKGKIRQ
jgi:DNA-binding transcriptional MerR regulator